MSYIDFYNGQSISSEDGNLSPRSVSKIDSLDDIDASEEEGIEYQKKPQDFTQIKLKFPEPIAILKPTLNKSATVAK